MSRRMSLPIAVVAVFVGLAAMPAKAAPPPTPDYFTADFSIRRVLDRGSRPDWAPDGRRIVFTDSDTRDTPAHEFDLASRRVRCLTCWPGRNGTVSRIYYLPDGNFLVLAGRTFGQAGAATAQADNGRSHQLYWLSKKRGAVPVALGAPAFGEIAISRRARGGGVKLAWGALDGKNRVVNMATLVLRSGQPALEAPQRIFDSSRSEGRSVGMAETYNFRDGDRKVTFYTVVVRKGLLDGEMYEADIASGALQPLYSDEHHNEAHLFPDERYILEESNRASDPGGAFRGISAHDAASFRIFSLMNGLTPPADEALQRYAPFGRHAGLNRPFDLFVRDLKTGRSRQLTTMGDRGGNAHQSAPAPDGRRVAFALDERGSPDLRGQGGLYIGEFRPARRR